MSTKASLQLQHQKNVVKYFTSFDVPHTVTLHVKDSKFVCNSVVLALHSSVFEKQIYHGQDQIQLDDLFFPGAETFIRDCVMFLHGDEIEIDIGSLPYFLVFSSRYEIKEMWTRCMEIVTYFKPEPGTVKSTTVILLTRLYTANDGMESKTDGSLVLNIAGSICRSNSNDIINYLVHDKAKPVICMLANLHPGLIEELLLSCLKGKVEHGGRFVTEVAKQTECGRKIIADRFDEFAEVFIGSQDFEKFAEILMKDPGLSHLQNRILELKLNFSFVDMQLNNPAINSSLTRNPTSHASGYYKKRRDFFCSKPWRGESLSTVLKSKDFYPFLRELEIFDLIVDWFKYASNKSISQAQYPFQNFWRKVCGNFKNLNIPPTLLLFVKKHMEANYASRLKLVGLPSPSSENWKITENRFLHCTTGMMDRSDRKFQDIIRGETVFIDYSGETCPLLSCKLNTTFALPLSLNQGSPLPKENISSYTHHTHGNCIPYWFAVNCVPGQGSGRYEFIEYVSLYTNSKQQFISRMNGEKVCVMGIFDCQVELDALSGA